MRFAWLFVIACSSTPPTPKDPFASGECDSHWQANGFTTCQEGCVDSAKVLGATGAACTAMLDTGSGFQCTATFDVGSATGCCASDKPNLYFAECP